MDDHQLPGDTRVRIPDKETYRRLSGALCLGNGLRSWRSLAELEASGYRGYVTQRGSLPGVSGTGLFIPNVSVDDVLRRSRGVAGVYWQEVPHRADCPGVDCHGCGRTINLEAMRSERGIYLRHAHHPTMNLRHDLIQNGQDVDGLGAAMVLRRYLQEDIEVLHDIWERFPDAVIEASRFGYPVGVLNSRLVVWEVRDY